MTRAKYRKGNPVKTIDLLLEQRSVYWRDRLIPVSFVIGMPLRVVLGMILRGYLFHAVPKEKV